MAKVKVQGPPARRAGPIVSTCATSPTVRRCGSLPPEYPEPAALKRSFPRYAADKMVLDQGQEGACTGFGLAAW